MSLCCLCLETAVSETTWSQDKYIYSVADKYITNVSGTPASTLSQFAAQDPP